MTILLADIHGFLDNLKAPIELVEHRVDFYRYVITAIFKAVGVSTEKLKFVQGSSYQKSPEYIMDVYKLSSVISEHDAKRAGAEVVKQTDNAPLSGLLYPILQVRGLADARRQDPILNKRIYRFWMNNTWMSMLSSVVCALITVLSVTPPVLTCFRS